MMVIGKGHGTAGSSSCHCSCQSQLHDRGGAMGQGWVKKLNVWLSRPNPEWFMGEGMKRSKILKCSTFCSHTFWTFDAYSRIKTIRTPASLGSSSNISDWSSCSSCHPLPGRWCESCQLWEWLRMLEMDGYIWNHMNMGPWAPWQW